MYAERHQDPIFVRKSNLYVCRLIYAHIISHVNLLHYALMHSFECIFLWIQKTLKKLSNCHKRTLILRAQETEAHLL